MPRVPVYQQQIRESVTPGVRLQGASAASFGANEARDLSLAGQALTDVGKFGFAAQAALSQTSAEEKAKAKAVARDALNRARSEALQTVTPIYGLKGKEAIDVYGSTEKQLNAIRQKYHGELSSDEERELFSSSYDGLMNEHLERVMTFQQKSKMDFEKLTIDAENQVSIDEAVAARTDPKAIANAEDTIRANTLFRHKDFDENTKKKVVGEAVQNLHTNIVQTIAMDSPLNAINYLEANKDKFDAKSFETFKKDLSDKGDEEWSRNEAMRITATGASFEEQLKMIDKIPDAKKADKVRKMVKERVADQEFAKQEKIKAVLDTEVDKVFQDPFGYQVPLSLDATSQEHLDTLQRRFKAEKRGEPQVTDRKVYYDLMKMTPAEFKKVNLLEYSGSLTTGDFQELVKLQKKDDNDYKNAQTFVNYVTNFAKDQAKDDFEQTSFIKEIFENELNKYPPEERGKVETWNKVKDTLVMDVDVKGAIFSTPYWKAKQKGKTINEPATRPPEVPGGAKWVDKAIDGKTYRGWEYTNPNGVKLIYMTDKQWYRVK